MYISDIVMKSMKYVASMTCDTTSKSKYNSQNTVSFQNSIMKIKFVFSRLTILINGTAYLLLIANSSNGLKDIIEPRKTGSVSTCNLSYSCLRGQ